MTGKRAFRHLREGVLRTARLVSRGTYLQLVSMCRIEARISNAKKWAILLPLSASM